MQNHEALQALYGDTAAKLADIRRRVDALNPAREMCATVNLYAERETSTGFEFLSVEDEERADALDNYDRALGLYRSDRGTATGESRSTARIGLDQPNARQGDRMLEDALAQSVRTASWGRIEDAILLDEQSVSALTSEDRPGSGTVAAADIRAVVTGRWVDGMAAYCYARGMRALDKPGEPLLDAPFGREGEAHPPAESDLQTPTRERCLDYAALALHGSRDGLMPVTVFIRTVGALPASELLARREVTDRMLRLQIAENARSAHRRRKPLSQLNLPSQTGRALRQFKPRERTYSQTAVWLRDEMWLRCPASRAYRELAFPAPYGADLLRLQMIGMRLEKRRTWANKQAAKRARAQRA